MALLNEQIRGEVRKVLGNVAEPVELLFHHGPPGEPAEFMEALLGELSEVVPVLRVVAADEAPVIEPHHDDGMPVEGPVLVIRRAGTDGGGVRFLGATAGLEFGSLIETIREVGEGKHHLEPETVQVLESLTHPVHIQVFTTPT
jgi:alkyl hydroperoxide reductase subunit AhpF